MKFLIPLALALLGSTSGDESVVNAIPGKVTILNYAEAENLRIYPLSYTGDAESFMILKDALDKGLVVVKEKNEGEVNTVLVKNKSSNPVFAMAGEVILGAKQDRMIENDLILPPSSGWLEVSVYCTEHGRWSGSSKEFAKADINVSPSVRANARANKSQSEVWNKVAENQEKVMGETSSTGAFNDIYTSSSYKGDRDKYWKKLEGLAANNTNMKGVIVCVGDQVVGIDLFSSHTMMKSYWHKLLESYIVEAMQGEEHGSVSWQKAKELLAVYTKADLDDAYTPGSGDLYEVDGHDSQGSALLADGILVHTDLFPEQETKPSRDYDIRYNE